MTILDRILAVKRREVAEGLQLRPLAALERRVRDIEPPRGLARALALEPTAAGSPAHRIIAEVKKASPSKGVIRADFDPVAIAQAYERGGASAISVLTDCEHFQGSLEHLTAIHAHVRLPLLRKDLVIDRYQIWEARAAGADAILLILAALPENKLLQELRLEAEGLGMDVLWEVHDVAELRRLLPLAPRLVGINNRNLRTFDVSLETTRQLLPELPAGVIAVSESGFCYRQELDEMRSWGVGAFLIGESLLRAADPGAALLELTRPLAQSGVGSRQ